MIVIDLYWLRGKDPRTPLGHASLVAALRHADGVDVHAQSLPVNEPNLDVRSAAETILDRVGGFSLKETALAIGAYIWNEPLINPLLAELRRRGFGEAIVLGGPQVTFSGPGLEARYPDVDVFIRGYAEQALVSWCKDPSVPVRGVHVAGTPDREELAVCHLAALPSPFLEGVIDPLDNPSFQRWETQRGCPFRCFFCQHRDAARIACVQSYPLDRLLAEVDLFVASGVASIAVLDPIFLASPHAATLLRRFRDQGFRGRLSVQGHFAFVTEAILDACEGLDVVFEFGLQTTDQQVGRVINRPNDLEKADRWIVELRRRGIRFMISLIYGLPTQTLESFRASVAWCRERGVEIVKAFPLMLLRGTQLDRDRARWGLIESDDRFPVVVQSDSFTRAEWEQMKRIANALDTDGGSDCGG